MKEDNKELQTWKNSINEWDKNVDNVIAHIDKGLLEVPTAFYPIAILSCGIAATVLGAITYKRRSRRYGSQLLKVVSPSIGGTPVTSHASTPLLRVGPVGPGIPKTTPQNQQAPPCEGTGPLDCLSDPFDPYWGDKEEPMRTPKATEVLTKKEIAQVFLLPFGFLTGLFCIIGGAIVWKTGIRSLDDMNLLMRGRVRELLIIDESKDLKKSSDDAMDLLQELSCINKKK